MKELDNSQKLILGKQGENRAVVIRFEIESWRKEFGEGFLRARHKRRTDELPYPVELITDDKYALWIVNESDNAVAGKGELELVYIADDGLIAKSITLDTYVYSSNVDIGEIPDAYEDWLVRLEKLANQATLAVLEYMDSHKDILRGEPGFSGIHYGEDPPQDERVNAWVIPSGEPDVPVTQEMLDQLESKIMKRTDERIGEEIGAVENGKY